MLTTRGEPPPRLVLEEEMDIFLDPRGRKLVFEALYNEWGLQLHRCAAKVTDPPMQITPGLNQPKIYAICGAATGESPSDPKVALPPQSELIPLMWKLLTAHLS
jgi:hypothetical protein